MIPAIVTIKWNDGYEGFGYRYLFMHRCPQCGKRWMSQLHYISRPRKTEHVISRAQRRAQRHHSPVHA